MTTAPLNVFARRAVSQLASIDPNGAAETMRRLNERAMELEGALSVATTALAHERIENADLRRHLQTLQTELLRLEEAV